MLKVRILLEFSLFCYTFAIRNQGNSPKMNKTFSDMNKMDRFIAKKGFEYGKDIIL